MDERQTKNSKGPFSRPIGPSGTRWCPKCKSFKEIHDFGVNGKRPYCRQCSADWYYQKHGKAKRKRVHPRQPEPSTGKHICRQCSQVKTVENFYRSSETGRYRPWCKSCMADLAKRSRPWSKIKQRANFAKCRREVLDAYGGKCVCCGESNAVFLTMDHVNNDGSEHRKQVGVSGVMWKIRSQGFPPNFQILCRNCNWAKYALGSCLHQSTTMSLFSP